MPLRRGTPGQARLRRCALRLLGGFRVERTEVGQAVSDWRRRSAKTLIKLLAVQPGHALHREQVIDVLWPGADAESALNSFGKALHAARHALEPELPRRRDSAYLRLADGMLLLNTEHVIVDTDEFDELAEAAIRGREIAAYEAALVAYGGELLPEDRYESWCSERRSGLAELHVRLLLGMAEALERRGSYNEAADRLRYVLQARSDARSCPSSAHAPVRADGNTRPGGTPVSHLRGHTAAGLDLAPQPETTSLCEEILAGRLSLQRATPDRNNGRADLR